MSKEFDFIDLYYLNDVSEYEKNSSDFTLLDEVKPIESSNIIRIIDSEESDSIAYTYEKFLEILDTQGLDGLVIK